MRVLVTGGAGFIGSHIVDALLAGSHSVVAVDNLSSGSLDNIKNIFPVHGDLVGRFSFYHQDITDFVMFMEYVKRYQFDVICHQAAQPSLRKSIDDPTFDVKVNVIGTLNVIKAAKEVGAHVVFSSTSAVYDPSGRLPYRESDCVKPHLPYGIAKATAERYIEDSGVGYTILRYSNIFGERQKIVGENQLVPHCLDFIFKGKEFCINGDGSKTRDFLYVGDVVKANITAMENRLMGIFNIGTNKPTSIVDMCNTIKGLCKWDGEFSYGPEKLGEVDNSRLDNNLANKIMGWVPQVSIESGLSKTIEWYKNEKN